jgi:hypothetical protein
MFYEELFIIFLNGLGLTSLLYPIWFLRFLGLTALACHRCISGFSWKEFGKRVRG